MMAPQLAATLPMTLFLLSQNCKGLGAVVTLVDGAQFYPVVTLDGAQFYHVVALDGVGGATDFGRDIVT